MKRNFLLTLLLTLLPFVGWAQDPVAKIVETETNYASLQAAIDAVITGQTIELVSSIEVAEGGFALGGSTTGTPTTPKNYTIDLNGKNITFSGYTPASRAFELKRADLDVTITNSGTEGGQITGTGDNEVASVGYSMIQVGSHEVEGSSLTIDKGVTVKCTNAGTILVACPAASTGEKKNSLNIKGAVTTTSQYDFTVGTNGTYPQKGAEINVYPTAEITGINPIYIPSGVCNITGGTITGLYCGVCIKGGELNISDGTITCTYDQEDDSEWAHNANGANYYAHALQIENVNYPAGTPVVSVTGGTFISTANPAVGSYAGNGQTKPVTKFLKGGQYSSDPSIFSNNPSNFVALGFKVEATGLGDVAYAVVPKDPETVYNVTVSGINGQTKAYGEPLELSVSLITTDQNTINGNPEYMNQVKSLLELEDDLQFAEANTSPTYRFRLAKDVTPTTVVEEGGHYVYTFGTDYINVPVDDAGGFARYIVKPTGSGSITITKAESNTLGNTVLATGLTYNAEERNLVATAATAEFGTPKYWATTDKDVTAATIPATAEWVEAAALKEMNAGDYYVFVKVDGNDNYPGVDAQLAADPNKVTIAQLEPDYANDATYKPTGAEFTFDNTKKDLAVAPTASPKAEYYYYLSDTEITDDAAFQILAADDSKWSTTIPTGKTAADAAKFVYWYAKGNDNIAGKAAATNQYVKATFKKATVTLALAEDNTTGKVKGFTDEYLWKGENKTVITNAPATGIVVNPSTLNLAPTYVIQKRGLGAEATWSDVTDNNVTELGTYRVTARVAEDANIAAATLADAYCFEFEVRKPKAYITITATPSIVGVGSLPVPGISVVWEDGDANTDAVTPNGVEYRYYYYETGHNDRYYGNTSNGLQRGTYYVGVVANNSTNLNALFNTTYHNVTSVTRSAVTVAPSQIEAEIAVQEGEFIYGQPLPLKLKYKSGYGEGTTDAEAIAAFDAATWGNGQLVAKNKETNVEYRLYQRTETHYGREVIVTKYRIPDSYNNYQYLPVGTYTVSANFETGNNSNAASIIAKTAQWTIVAKDINNKDVTYDEDGNTTEFEVFGIGTSSLSNDVFNLSLPYTGEQIVPTRSNVTPFSYAYTDMKAEDYDIEVTGANINAGEKVGTFKVIGKGNFKGETDLKFTISKKPIDVYPISNPELTWAIGSDASSYENKIDYAALEGLLVGQDNKTVNKYTDFDVKTAKGFKDLKVRRLAEVSVGRYPQGAEAYLPEGAEEAENYEFRFRTAPLTVTKGKINLKVKPRVEAEYKGTSTPDFAFDFVVAEGSTLSEVLLDNDNWKTLIGTPGNPTWNAQTKQWNIVWDLEAIKEGDDRYVATKTYTVDYNPDKAPELLGAKKNSEKMVANNYEVTVLPTATVAGKDICRGEASVTKANIEFTVLNQNVAKAADVVKAVKFGGADATVEISDGGYKPGDDNYKNFVVDQITVTGNNLTLAQVAENKVNKNYNVKVNPGTWGLAPTEEILELKSTEDDLAKLETKRLVKTVKLTLLQPEMKKNDGTIEKFQWLKNEWHALVLPFDAKVSEISNAFGYAIVNVVNPDGASEGDVVFKMPEVTEMIKANTPFCIKVAKDIFDNDPETTKVTDKYTATFELDREADEDQGFLVVDPQGTHVSIAADNGDFGYTFDGTYVEKQIKKNEYYLRFLGKNSKWSKIGATSNAVFDMQPYTGYVNLGEGFTGTREVNFIFEEEDGSTTVIKDVDFMNGNKANAEGLYRVDGIKLQSVPTQKGVYIQDGKKFVK